MLEIPFNVIYSLIFHCSEHAGHQESMLFDGTDAHSEEEIWAGPDVGVFMRFERHTTHEMRYFT